MKIGNQMKRSILLACVFLLAAVLSIAIPGRHFSRPEAYAGSVQELNEAKLGVEKLAGSAAAASAAITLMPGDFGTPIADKLADLSGYFLIILCAIYIEKFLVSVAGILAFDVLVPIGCVLLAIGAVCAISIKKAALRLISLGLILALLVPVSINISRLIEKQYAEEIRMTIDEANQNSEDLRGTADRSDDESLWAEFTAKIKGGSDTLMKKMESLLSAFIDAIAMYIVTTCVIPIATLILGIWLVKTLFKLDFRIPTSMRLSSYTTRKFREARGRERRRESPEYPEEEGQ